MAYFLIKHLELSFRERGDEREVELILRSWDKLRVGEYHVEAQGYRSTAWQWQLGELGQSLQEEMKNLQVSSAVDRYRHSLLPEVS